MENYYNDETIIALDQMEQIAKEYHNQLNKKNKLKEIAECNKIKKTLENLIDCYETLQYVSFSKFYYDHKQVIHNHMEILNQLYCNFNGGKKCGCRLKFVSFSKILRMLINNLLQLLDVFYEMEDRNNYHIINGLLFQVVDFV